MTKKKCASAPAPTGVVLEIHTALTRDDRLSPMELAKKLGCNVDVAKLARAQFFTPHVEHRPGTK